MHGRKGQQKSTDYFFFARKNLCFIFSFLMSCIEQIPQNWITRIYSEVCYGYISQGEVSVLLDESEGGGSDRLVTLDSGAYIEGRVSSLQCMHCVPLRKYLITTPPEYIAYYTGLFGLVFILSFPYIQLYIYVHIKSGHIPLT